MHNDITIQYILGDTDDKLLTRLVGKIEGVNGPSGLVVPGSISIISRSAPYLERNVNGGVTHVIVTYESDVLTLKRGTTIPVTITKVGRLSAAGEMDHDGFAFAMAIIPYEIQDKELSLRVGMTVRCEVLASQVGVGWEQIKSVVRVI